MKPEDVPDDLIDLFDKGSYERASAYAGHSQIDNEREYFRGGLAAVLPAHEAMIRAETATEIDQLRTIRTLQAMWAKLGTHGLPVEREVWAQVARDLGKVLGQPGAQPKKPRSSEPGDQEGTTP